MTENFYNTSIAALRAEPKRCRVTALQGACTRLGANLKFLRCRSVSALAVLILITSPAVACNYGELGFEPGDSEQTDVDGLFRGIYDDRTGYKTADWRKEAQRLKRQENSSDLIERLDYAWALHLANENEKAIPVYEEILKLNPNHYETLCSYATVLHDMRQYPKAAEILKKAVALKPGFRNHAEEFHLDMIDYQHKSQLNPKFAEDQIFIPELSPLWMNHPLDVETNLSTVETWPEHVTSEGIAELVRQFPYFGDGWMAMGMALEHEEDFSMAAKAYDRALDKGTRHAARLKEYMATFREFGQSKDPARLGGQRVIQLGIALVALAVGWFFIKFIAGFVSDVTQKRADKANKKRAERLKNWKDPDAPL